MSGWKDKYDFKENTINIAIVDNFTLDVNVSVSNGLPLNGTVMVSIPSFVTTLS